MWRLLLLTCSLVSSVLGESSFLSYILLAPAEVHYPSKETAYVHISGVETKLKVTITLQCSGHDNILLQQEVNPPGLARSIKFQIYPPQGGIEEVVTLHISLVGPKTRITDSKKMLVRNTGSATLIQSDKPIYKPGQTVNIRILNFDRDFNADNDVIPLMELQDPNGNRIGQWLNLTPDRGIINLTYSLDSEAQLGAYIIKAPNANQFFHVLQYVVPSFEVIITLPPVVTILDLSVPIKICGRYTFGKPVRGEINGKLCRRASCYYWNAYRCPDDICKKYKGRTDKNGCLDVEISTESYHFHSYDYHLNFEAEVSFVEDGTGYQMNASSICRISAMIAKVTFEDLEISDSYYKPGIDYRAKMKLLSADGTPMKSKTLYLTVKYEKVVKEQVYETDENGEATFSLNTKEWNRQSVFLLASYLKNKPERNYGELNPYFIEAHQTLQPFAAITNSYIKVQPLSHVLSCDRVHQIEIEYIIRGSEIITEEDFLEFHYLVVARGDLVLNGHLKVSINKDSVTMGTVELPLMVTADFSPMARIMVYALIGNGRMTADTEQFPVTKCFHNKVTLNYSTAEAPPGSNVTLHVNAQPGSLCAVRVVDEGVLFMRPEAEISSETAFSFLSKRNQYGYPYPVQERDPICWNRRQPSFSFGDYGRRKRSVNMMVSSAVDEFSLFKRLGLKIITNVKVKKPKECPQSVSFAPLSNFGSPFIGSHVPRVHSSYVDERLDEEPFRVTLSIVELTKRIRKSFPETLFCDVVSVGASGQADMQVQLPDSITEWKTNAFCMGDAGLGIASTASIKALQPVFIVMNLPYDVVKGETFSFTVSIFNYLPEAIMVIVHLEDTPELEFSDCPTCFSPQCVFPEQAKVFTWEAKTLHIGTAKIVMSTKAIYTEELCGGEQPIVPENAALDSLMKTIKIKAEGMPVEKFYNSIVCGRAGVSSENISLVVPPDAVPDSTFAEFSIVGDIMGSALQGIENLLDRPIGCGEQVMVTLVPNIYIMDYLQSANLHTEDTQIKGYENILHGYQRALNYQREDGSFSAFGDKDEEGNTWLTAFVAKTFSAAYRYIPVDLKTIQKSLTWLKDCQDPNGGFKNRGKLFKASLKGSIEDDISLNVYIAMALLETEQNLQGEIVDKEMKQNALQSLRNTALQVDSLNVKALLAYTFTLSGDDDIRESLLQDLDKRAVKSGGETYWPANPSISKKSAWTQSSSNEVELASYVVLAHLSKPVPTAKDISKASSIGQWLVRQRNPHGGFNSTQDTFVAFQAISLLSKITYTRHGGLQVILKQIGKNFLHQFQLDESTRLLLQKKQLPEVPGDYNVQATGEGCAFIQITLKYNTQPDKASPFFDLQLNIATEEKSEHSEFLIYFTFTVRYTGTRNATNMVLLEAELPSGYSAVPESVTQLKTHNLVGRTETPDGKVVIYLIELCKDVVSFTFSARQDYKVENQKPRFVKMYDYYQTGEETSMMYEVPSQ